MDGARTVDSIVAQCELIARLQRRTLAQFLDDCDSLHQRSVAADHFRHCLQCAGFGLRTEEIDAVIAAFACGDDSREISLDLVDQAVQRLFGPPVSTSTIRDRDSTRVGTAKSPSASDIVDDTHTLAQLARRIAHIRSQHHASLRASAAGPLQSESDVATAPTLALTLDWSETLALGKHFSQCQQLSQTINGDDDGNGSQQPLVASAVKASTVSTATQADEHIAYIVLPRPPPPLSLPTPASNAHCPQCSHCRAQASGATPSPSERKLVAADVSDALGPFTLLESTMPGNGRVEAHIQPAANVQHSQPERLLMEESDSRSHSARTRPSPSRKRVRTVGSMILHPTPVLLDGNPAFVAMRARLKRERA